MAKTVNKSTASMTAQADKSSVTTPKKAPKKKVALPLADRFAKIGLKTDWDFVLHFPLRFEDHTHITPVEHLSPEMLALTEVQVQDTRVISGRNQQLVVTTADKTGTLNIRLLRYYPSQLKLFRRGQWLRLYGKVSFNSYSGQLEMIHPQVTIIDPNCPPELPQSLTPIYPTAEGIRQESIRVRIENALSSVDLSDIVPSRFTVPVQMPELKVAIDALHHPKPGMSATELSAFSDRQTPAWRRIKFDEFLAQQITLRHARAMRSQFEAIELPPQTNGYYDRLLENLPFKLTNAQQRALNEITQDLNGLRPMNRLVQGDVGCGKTVVAALAAARALDNGFQVALMAPTEILAQQHYNKLTHWLKPLGINVVWLAGSLKAKEKAQNQALIATGDAQLVIGTHALIQESVHFKKLGLAIIDEQHRFGVMQRLKLRSDEDSEQTFHSPHLLMLSATPIPRTLAMSYLTDIDVSVINELPPGRSPIDTRLVSMTRLDDVISAVAGNIAQGQQCYWVCPLIEESEKIDLSAATERFELLQQMLPNIACGLVHGAMTAAQKQTVMDAFLRNELQLLVATTVIEVGVDVPNASIMVIEHAERFGLSQLHQLRGRVGRGSVKSYCVLLFDPDLGPIGKERLRVIHQSTDGFEIAREDLRIRGPGEFMGERQSGAPLLRFADIDLDSELLEYARDCAQEWLATDPDQALRHASRWYQNRSLLIAA